MPPVNRELPPGGGGELVAAEAEAAAPTMWARVFGDAAAEREQAAAEASAAFAAVRFRNTNRTGLALQRGRDSALASRRRRLARSRSR
jgi:hypothetical protein